MITQLLTMIGGKDDHGIVPLAIFFEPGEDTAKAIIHFTNQAGISGAHLANGGFIKRARCAAGAVEEGTLLDITQIVLK